MAAIDTEALTLRIPREAADLLRRLAGSDGGRAKPVEDLAADLLTDAARRREHGLELRDRRLARAEAAEQHLRDSEISEEEIEREIDEVIKEVRAEKSLRQRHEELQSRKGQA